MIKQHVETLAGKDSEELQRELIELLSDNPAILFHPYEFLESLSGEIVERPEGVTQKREALLKVLAEYPESAWSLEKICFHMRVENGDRETKIVIWNLVDNGTLEFDLNWNVKLANNS